MGERKQGQKAPASVRRLRVSPAMTTTMVTTIKMTAKVPGANVTIEVAIMTGMMKVIEIMMERKVAIRVISVIVIIWIIGVPIGGVPNTAR